MKRKAQIEDIIVFFALILIIASALIYYFYFKTGSVPVFKPRKEIQPAEKGVVPPGIFFPRPKEEKLPLIFPKFTYAQTLKPEIGINLKPNKNIETFINHKYKDLNNIETNKIEFEFYAKNKKNLQDKFYFAYLLMPINKKWVVLQSNKLFLELPKKPSYYLLLATAINTKNEFDPSFVYLIFKINVSPYFQNIKINQVSNGDFIVLRNFSTNTINITNWRLVSSMGNFLIPQAIEFVDPFRIYERRDVILQPNDEARIMIAPSPLGINFRANKCFNYLSNSYPTIRNFLGRTNLVCDKISREELLELRKSGYSLNCILVLEKAGCTGPAPRDLETIKTDSRCLNFISSKWTYRVCYENRKNDNDFLSPIWYIFLPTKKLYASRYEEIKLIDEKGLLVDKYVIY